MSKYATVDVTVRVVIENNSGAEIEEIVNEMDYNMVSNTPNAKIIDTEFVEMEELQKG